MIFPTLQQWCEELVDFDIHLCDANTIVSKQKIVLSSQAAPLPQLLAGVCLEQLP